MKKGHDLNTKIVKVELGSGFHGIPDFIHIDAVKVGNVDFEADIRNLKDLIPNDIVDELYSAHVLEHISYTEVAEVLQEWCRILKPGGMLTIKMPDLDFACKAYVEGIHSPEEIMLLLYGCFSDTPGGGDGWEKVSGNPNWDRATIETGMIPHPGKYTIWGAHKALYTYDMIRIRLENNGFHNVNRVVENDWELHVVAKKRN